MLSAVKARVNQLRLYLRRSRDRGRGVAASLVLDLPAAIAGRSWRAAATPLNDHLLSRGISSWAVRRLLGRQRLLDEGLFYIIVMPGTLHYLIPCLRLLPESLRVCLLFNGAARWEQRLLQQQFPRYFGLPLASLPRSSLSHGAVITLLLRENRANFGLLDHDLYLFEPTLFSALEMPDRVAMKAIFGDFSMAAGRHYPHTWFLYFNTREMQRLMREYRLDARIYRRAPARVRAQLAAAGLGEGQYLKDYLKFHDTLHVLLGVAWSEGLRVEYLALEQDDAMHLGGTSGGSPGTRHLTQIYTALRFLEFVADPRLMARYLPGYAPFKSAEDVMRRLPLRPEVTRVIEHVDTILARLEASLAPDRCSGSVKMGAE